MNRGTNIERMEYEGRRVVAEWPQWHWVTTVSGVRRLLRFDRGDWPGRRVVVVWL